MTLPPGHYGRAGEAAPSSTPPTRAVERLSWRWFLPRSRRGRVALFACAGALALVVALFVDAMGLSFAAVLAVLGVFDVVGLGVALRRAPLLGVMGRLARADPIGAAELQDGRSRVAAYFGVVLLMGALLGSLVSLLASWVSG